MKEENQAVRQTPRKTFWVANGELILGAGPDALVGTGAERATNLGRRACCPENRGAFVA